MDYEAEEGGQPTCLVLGCPMALVALVLLVMVAVGIGVAVLAAIG